jgi:hypothetical protein
MGEVAINLEELLPEDWFYEVPDMPQGVLNSVGCSFYTSDCPELMGNVVLELYQSENGAYFMKQMIKEPIGDYGSRWVEIWYACNNSDGVKAVLEAQEGMNHV